VETDGPERYSFRDAEGVEHTGELADEPDADPARLRRRRVAMSEKPSDPAADLGATLRRLAACEDPLVAEFARELLERGERPEREKDAAECENRI
jgi:hypothetical protein